VVFEKDAVREIARMAAEANRTVENIGARRLHTVIERIMEDISFKAGSADGGLAPGSRVVVDAALVRAKLAPMLQKNDLSKFIL